MLFSKSCIWLTLLPKSGNKKCQYALTQNLSRDMGKRNSNLQFILHVSQSNRGICRSLLAIYYKRLTFMCSFLHAYITKCVVTVCVFSLLLIYMYIQNDYTKLVNCVTKQIRKQYKHTTMFLIKKSFYKKLQIKKILNNSTWNKNLF